jgi:hypothetical protein
MVALRLAVNAAFHISFERGMIVCWVILAASFAFAAFADRHSRRG